jgi:preprotein translocase subunit SecY
MVYIDQAERKIPIQYSNAYNIKRKEEVSFLPIKVNIAGVIPIIFASSMILAPQAFTLFFPNPKVDLFISRYFNFDNP